MNECAKLNGKGTWYDFPKVRIKKLVGTNMMLIRRMENKIAKLEKSIEKKQKQIEKLRTEWKKNKVTVFHFISQKRHIGDKINDINSEIRVLKDKIVEKKKLMEGKLKEREYRKKRVDNYFEWCKKHENIENKGGEIKYAGWR